MRLAQDILLWLPLETLLQLQKVWPDLVPNDLLFRRFCTLTGRSAWEERPGDTPEISAIRAALQFGEIPGQAENFRLAPADLLAAREIYLGRVPRIWPERWPSDCLELALERENWPAVELIVAAGNLAFSTFANPRLLERHAGAHVLVERRVRELYPKKYRNVALVKLAGFFDLPYNKLESQRAGYGPDAEVPEADLPGYSSGFRLYEVWLAIGRWRRGQPLDFGPDGIDPDLAYQEHEVFPADYTIHRRLILAFKQLLPRVIEASLKDWPLLQPADIALAREDMRVIEPEYLARAEKMLQLLPQLEALGQEIPALYRAHLLVLLGRPVSLQGLPAGVLPRLKLEMIRVAHPQAPTSGPVLESLYWRQDDISTVFYDLSGNGEVLPRLWPTERKRRLRWLFILGQSYPFWSQLSRPESTD